VGECALSRTVFVEAIESGEADALMRRDADALEAAVVDGEFRAYVYRFAAPSVTAGRNARVSDADLAHWRERGHAFARRPTGGGVIRHEDDISFGIVFPGTDAFATDHLRTVSQAIGAALREEGIETACGPASASGAAPPNSDVLVGDRDVTPSSARQDVASQEGGGGTASTPGAAPGKCFAGAVGVERVYRGEKLVGLAARRVRGATLVQGSMTVRRHPERDLAVLGLGPRVDLDGTGFDPERFARRFRALLSESL
jgi:lipoate-protein ligase A